jgi:hypothetical protein
MLWHKPHWNMARMKSSSRMILRIVDRGILVPSKYVSAVPAKLELGENASIDSDSLISRSSEFARGSRHKRVRIVAAASSASDRMTPSTSPTSSGSSAEVGSSKSSAFGFIASARAMATRCFCPPES